MSKVMVQTIVLYAGILNASGRHFYSAQNNPVIRTEPRNNTIQNDPPYRIIDRRPVLSCWQTTAWEMEGKRVGTYDLSQLPSLNETVSPFLRETIFLKDLGLPRVTILASILGPHAITPATSQLSYAAIINPPMYLQDAF
jgi:hypothetical protein